MFEAPKKILSLKIYNYFSKKILQTMKNLSHTIAKYIARHWPTAIHTSGAVHFTGIFPPDVI